MLGRRSRVCEVHNVIINRACPVFFVGLGIVYTFASHSEPSLTMTRKSKPVAERLERSLNLSLEALSSAIKVGSHSPDEALPAQKKGASSVDVRSYTSPFLSFITENPTVFHAVAHFAKKLEFYGFIRLSERASWTTQLKKGGKYFVERNGSSLIAFTVGMDYKAGNGASMIASHVDALAARLKPVSSLSTKAGYTQLAVAPYAGGLNTTWFDRDLGIGGRVLVMDRKSGKIETKLVKLGWPVARIPTLAPHFGADASLSNVNKETQMVPIIGLESAERDNERKGGPKAVAPNTFAATQPSRLVKVIAEELGIVDCKCQHTCVFLEFN